MGNTRVVNVVVAAVFLLAVFSAVSPPAHAAWVNNAGTQFQVGGQLSAIEPTAAGTSFDPPAVFHQGHRGAPRWPSFRARSWPGSIRSCTPSCWS